MVRKCIICQKTWNKMIYRSFHKFPKEYVRRETWMEHLYVTESDLLKTKDALVCSDHFELKDVYTNFSGQRFLKFNAVPKKLVILEVPSLNSSQNVLPTLERDEDKSSILNEPTDTYIEEEKKLFWNVDIKQEPYDLYLENISSPIEQHVNASPNFEECNVLVKKELNSDNNNEHTEQDLQCSTKKKQRKLKKYDKKTTSLGGIIVCEVCGNMFTKLVDFFWHFLNSHHFEWRKIYKTKIKQKQIDNTKTTINYNTIPIDPNTDVKEEIEVVEQELKEESLETDRLNNVDDFKSCFNENVISNHINTENSDTDKKTSPFPQNRCFNTNLHQKEKPFTCGICSKIFFHQNPLNVHMSLHTGEKPFKCEICSKSYKEKKTLIIHMRSHTGEKPFKCGICLKCFSKKSPLEIHLRRHKGETPFSCEVCSKSFVEKETLRIHMRSHTGEKPYECKVCLKSFTVCEYLKRHMRCHTGEKPYKCEVCLKSFRVKGSLNTHMRCHTGEKPYKCEVCSKSFTQSTNLNRHMRCHTGKKPYKCKVCFKYFSVKSNLKSHMRCHTGEKPYECKVCLKSFTQCTTLNRHMRCHTGEKP